MSQDLPERLIALETQLAFQQQTLDDLSAALIDALKTQKRLERIVGELTGKLDRIAWTAEHRPGATDPNQALLDDKPPHY
ncbi:MAG: SlyX family protein [Pirellulales bacterium]